MTGSIRLSTVAGRYGIARLAADAAVPGWFNGPGLAALVRADDELTIVCSIDRIPADIKVDGPWTCFRSIGPFAFEATGIVQSLVNPLSNAGIGVFVLCTFDGEHLLVPERDSVRAAAVLTEAGHDFQN